MADLRINRWSEESLKCNPIWIKLFDTSGEESILVLDCSGGFETRLDARIQEFSSEGVQVSLTKNL